MSKEKQEVGDVWENKDMNIKILIVGIDKYNIGIECLLYDIDCNFLYIKVFYFLTNLQYLGKSKVSIKELFDVSI